MMLKIYHALLGLFATLVVSIGSAVAYGEGGHSVAKASGPAFDDPTKGWYHLHEEMLIDITVIGVFFALLTIYLLVKYRRTPENQVGTAKKFSKAQMFGWAFIPAFLFLADDLFLAAQAWDTFNDYRTVPENAYEVKLESSMYAWNFTHPNGVEQTSELVVPAGRPVVVRMTSSDVVHSLFLPDFRVKEDSMPGRVTYLWFYPENEGEYLMTCAEYCGVGHSYMYGNVIAKSQGAFDKWMKEEVAQL